MFSYKANAICMAGMTMPAGAGVVHRTVGTEFGNPDSSLIMPDFDLTGELLLKIELHMLRPITEKVHTVAMASFVSAIVFELFSDKEI